MRDFEGEVISEADWQTMKLRAAAAKQSRCDHPRVERVAYRDGAPGTFRRCASCGAVEPPKRS